MALGQKRPNEECFYAVLTFSFIFVGCTQRLAFGIGKSPSSFLWFQVAEGEGEEDSAQVLQKYTASKQGPAALDQLCQWSTDLGRGSTWKSTPLFSSSSSSCSSSTTLAITTSPDLCLRDFEPQLRGAAHL